MINLINNFRQYSNSILEFSHPNLPNYPHSVQDPFTLNYITCIAAVQFVLCKTIHRYDYFSLIRFRGIGSDRLQSKLILRHALLAQLLNRRTPEIFSSKRWVKNSWPCSFGIPSAALDKKSVPTVSTRKLTEWPAKLLTFFLNLLVIAIGFKTT